MLAERLVSLCRTVPRAGASVVALHGDLGAGKTTFVQELARVLGVSESVVSPTFLIMRSYELSDDPDFSSLSHLDAYRIEEVSEMGPLRFEELVADRGRLVVIEWAERIAPLLPSSTIHITFTSHTDESRTVELVLP